jgi:hypothetical protein
MRSVLCWYVWQELAVKMLPRTHHADAKREREYNSPALGRGEWSASHPGRALPPRMEPRYPLDRRVGGSQSCSEHRG